MNVLTNASAKQYGDGKLLQSVGEGIAAQGVGDRFVAAADARSIPLAVVVTPPVGDVKRYAAPLILIRPDGFVAWVGSDFEVTVSAAEALLSKMCGH